MSPRAIAGVTAFGSPGPHERCATPQPPNTLTSFCRLVRRRFAHWKVCDGAIRTLRATTAKVVHYAQAGHNLFATLAAQTAARLCRPTMRDAPNK